MASELLQLFYCDHYPFPLPPDHKFPLAKYRLLREELENDAAFTLKPASLGTTEDLLRVHDASYVRAFLDGSIESSMMRRIGFPWSPELVRRTLASVGSTLCAAKAALESGFGGTLAGGTHHAYRAEGAGFCVFNDLAVAIEWARAKAGLRRFAVVDLDVHQGDGTAAIFDGDQSVFTLSVHGDRNFPLRKKTSTLDVPLPDGLNDAEYLKALENALVPVRQFQPELILFQAGVDGLASDKLGRLALTHGGLLKRDAVIADFARELDAPLLTTIGGGYSDLVEDTVRAHVQTFRTIAERFRSESPARLLDAYGAVRSTTEYTED